MEPLRGRRAAGLGGGDGLSAGGTGEAGPQGAGFARLNLGTSPALVEKVVERLVRAIGRA